MLTAQAAQPPPAPAIASAHPLATQAGHKVLADGGNAFDAAVAVSAALAVVEPYSSGLGGGGFWLLHRVADKKQVMLDGRERAPLAAVRDMYLDQHGRKIPGASINGPLSAGIPGEPAALVHLSEHYGRLPLRRSLAPAIHLARDGFPADEHYRKMAEFRLQALQQSPAASKQFLHNGQVPEHGQIIRQPELADTLELLAEKGFSGFYEGELAQKLVDGNRHAGGIWTLDDLSEYRVHEREPIYGEYQGLKIMSASPPSSGGIALVQMLNMLSLLELEKLSDTERAHYLVEIMRRAFHDRARYLGDPDYVRIPIERLTGMEYAEQLLAGIDGERATASSVLETPGTEGMDTTHFSIIDDAGNRVSATLSINYPFGSCFVPPGTGVLLNDEMDDFSASPGMPNAYGLVGADANAIEPGKRMLSSMTPTIVEGPDGVAILGTPGGSRIISMVLLGLLEYANGKDAEAWVSRPRFHHQYLPDVILFEPGAIDESVQSNLVAMGHALEEHPQGYGNMQAVHWDRKKNRVTAASDPRGLDRLVVD